MGKGWSKGLTATSDARVAKAAAAHRGRTYVRHLTPPQDRRFRGRVGSLDISWSPVMAYALGLVATDGCLSGDGRHIAYVSKDLSLIRTWLAIIGRPHLKVRTVRSSTGGRAYRVDAGHVVLYRWLLERGLTPRKSLTLGAIDVPSPLFVDLLRGLLDGDGTIYTRRHQPTKKSYPNYWYERLWTYFTSASPRHIDWLRRRIKEELGLASWVELRRRPGRNDFYRLKFGNVASMKLLAALYADPKAPHLARKKRKWLAYVQRNGAEGGI